MESFFKNIIHYPIHVLIVGDGQLGKLSIKEQLKGYKEISTLSSVTNLKKAKKVAVEVRLDVAIVDYLLPDGRGIDLIELLANVPVILLTGKGEDSIAVECFKAGATDCITKDSDENQLSELVLSIDQAVNSAKEKNSVTELYQNLIDVMDNTSDLIQSANLDGEVEFVNKCWLEILGYNSFTGLNVLDVIHPESQDHCKKLMRDIGNKRLISDEPVLLITAKGQRLETSANISCRFDSTGRPTGTQMIFQNMTNLNKEKDLLKKTENKYKLLVESADDTIYQIDSKGNFIFVNSLGTVLTGYTKDEFIGMNFMELVESSYFHDVSTFYREQRSKMVHTSYLELPIRRKDGGLKWIGQNITALFDEELTKVSGFLGIVRDITSKREMELELKESKEQLEVKIQARTRALQKTNDLLVKSKNDYQTLFQKGNDPVIIYDAECSKILEVNSKACDLYGYSRTEFIGMNNSMLLSDSKNILNDFYDGIVTHKTAQGKILMMQINSASLEYKDKAAIMSINHDVTRRVVIEEELEKERQSNMAEVIKGQERVREKISRDLHDNIGQGLAALIINLRAIHKYGELSSQQNVILKDAEVLNRSLIKEIRNVSKNLKPQVLYDFGLEKALEDLASNKEIGVNLEFSKSKDFPRLDSEKETALFRIAQEAVNNAVRHSGATTVEIDLSKKNNVISLRIVDDGRGIDLKHSTGTGMVNMKERSTFVNGQLTIESKRPRGTEVKISLVHYD